MDVCETDDMSTPLSADEKEGLKLDWITLRAELNEVEAGNIAQAHIWLLSCKSIDIYLDTFLRTLHKKMFDQVWSWAGKYRTTEKNIGAAPGQIPIKLMQLFHDVTFWIENKFRFQSPKCVKRGKTIFPKDVFESVSRTA